MTEVVADDAKVVVDEEPAGSGAGDAVEVPSGAGAAGVDAAGSAAAGSEGDPAGDGDAKGRRTVSASVDRLQARIAGMEASQKTLAATNERLVATIDGMKRGADRRAAEEALAKMQTEHDSMAAKLKTAEEKLVGLLTPEEAAAKAREEADKAATAVRAKEGARRGEATSQLSEAQTELETLRAKVAELDTASKQEREARMAAEARARAAGAVNALNGAGLRAEFADVAARILEFPEDYNPADKGHVKGLVDAFQKAYPAMFAGTGQTTGGVPPRSGAAGASTPNMNDIVRRELRGG